MRRKFFSIKLNDLNFSLDIIGCMIDLDKKEISFSLNGKYLGIAHENVQIDHCPYFAGFSIYGNNSAADFHLKSNEMKYFIFCNTFVVILYFIFNHTHTLAYIHTYTYTYTYT
jgi:hypothetical protein